MKIITVLLVCLLFITSCNEEYLNKKSDKALIVPHTLKDLEAILSNADVMNASPGLGILSVDDWFFTDEGWNSLVDVSEKHAYRWDADIYQGLKSYSEWSIPYKQVFYANTVLDLLPDLRNTASSDTEWNQVKGRALFHRAFSHYQLAQLFCQPYSQGGENNPGIPVRTSSNLGIPVRRATVKETYDQIIADLEEAKTLLPVKAVHALYPSLPAALAMLSKVHLAMQHYEQAEKYAGQVLQLQSTLLNYNTLDPTSVRPFPRFNAEVLFHEESYVYQFTYSPLAYMDTLLYDSYAPNDLRKTVFFRNRVPGRYTFKGQYSGIASLFTGLAIDEVYLTRAECRARSGNVAGALEDLNTLLVTRFKTNTFVPIAVTNSDALLEIILQERRKQLVFRPERWTDSRRLNQDARFERTMARKLQGQLYHLAPNSQRYVFEIPVDEITYSNIEQNPR